MSRVRKRKRVKADKVSGQAKKLIRYKLPFSDEEEEEVEVETMVFDTDPAYVRVNAGVTKNLGNYESLRVDVSLSIPCPPEVVDDVFVNVADKVADLLDSEVQKYLEGE